MYTIINKTKNTTINHSGDWPLQYLEDLLNAGDKLIVLSTYSNTIKIPYLEVLNGENEWCFEDYNYSGLTK